MSTPPSLPLYSCLLVPILRFSPIQQKKRTGTATFWPDAPVRFLFCYAELDGLGSRSSGPTVPTQRLMGLPML